MGNYVGLIESCVDLPLYRPLSPLRYEDADDQQKIGDDADREFSKALFLIDQRVRDSRKRDKIVQLLALPLIWKSEVVRIYEASVNALVYITKEGFNEFPLRTQKMVATLKEAFMHSDLESRKMKIFLTAGRAHLIRTNYADPRFSLEPLYEMLAKVDRSVVILYPKAIHEAENSECRELLEETKELYKSFKSLFKIQESAQVALDTKNLHAFRNLIFRTYISCTRAISTLCAEEKVESLEKRYNEYNPREDLYKLVRKLGRLDQRLIMNEHSWEFWNRKVAKIEHKMMLIRERCSAMFREVVWES